MPLEKLIFSELWKSFGDKYQNMVKDFQIYMWFKFLWENVITYDNAHKIFINQKMWSNPIFWFPFCKIHFLKNLLLYWKAN